MGPVHRGAAGARRAVAAAAVELTGGDGHPLPDDWALAALGGSDVGTAGDDGDAHAGYHAAAAAAAAAVLLLTVLLEGGLLRVGGCNHGAPGAALVQPVRHWWAMVASR